MTKPMLLAEFTRLPSVTRSLVLDGLSGAIDLVAEAAPETHRFLRYQWFAAALAADGGAARTILVEHDGHPVIALPMVRVGPGPARLATLAGNDRPFRSFPASVMADGGAYHALLDQLGREVNALRIGPIRDGDPALAPLLAAARAKGWAALDRVASASDLPALPAAPGGAEDRLAGQGALDWRFLQGAELGAVRLGATIDVHGRGAFWRGAAADPVLARMMSMALVTVDGAPVAFSLDLCAGACCYAIADGEDPAFAAFSPAALLRGRLRAAGAEATDPEDRGTGPVLRDWLLVRPGLPALLGRALRPLWTGARQAPDEKDRISPAA
ncbi:MAG: GNAT family N-acetyltransferase [Pseudomonadota bacterium]